MDLWARGFERVEHHSHTYILKFSTYVHIYYTARLVHGVHSYIQIVDLPLLELNLLNFHLFLIFHEPKG